MTAGKASALAAGFVGAIVLGVAIGATMDDKWTRETTPAAVTEKAPAPAPAAARPSRPARTASATAPRRAERTAPPAGSVSTVAVEMWEPELRDRAKDVLNPGAKLQLAAADFESAEEFMTVAHAARNTSVPFMVLKHRVVNEHQSLADALRESKPDLDVKAEVARARAAARADLAS